MDPTLPPQESNAAAVIDVAKEAAQNTMTLKEVNPTTDYVVVDRDGAARILDLSSLLDKPKRPEGTYKPATLLALIDYVEKHEQGDHTTLWVHPTSGNVVAILDDHSAKWTAWRKHRAELKLLVTEEWQFWTRHDGNYMSQQEFAELLQEGLPDIAKPDGADLLETCSTIQATTNATFRSGFRLDNGEVKMQYDEEIDGKAGKHGELSIPEEFLLSLAPFVGNEKVVVAAHLRYRIRGGNLSVGYKLQQPDRVVQAALEEIADKLAKKFSRVYRGTPA
jgi:uncharacterized protein YfdQ (DUF2303 family)